MLHLNHVNIWGVCICAEGSLNYIQRISIFGPSVMLAGFFRSRLCSETTADMWTFVSCEWSFSRVS